MISLEKRLKLHKLRAKLLTESYVAAVNIEWRTIPGEQAVSFGLSVEVQGMPEEERAKLPDFYEDERVVYYVNPRKELARILKEGR